MGFLFVGIKSISLVMSQPRLNCYHSESFDRCCNWSKKEDEKNYQDYADDNCNEDCPLMYSPYLLENWIKILWWLTWPNFDDPLFYVSEIKIVTYNSCNDMHDEIYAGYAENNKCDKCLYVHFPVQHPDKSESAGWPVPCWGKFVCSWFGELWKLIYVIVCVGANKCPYFVTADAIGVHSVNRRAIMTHFRG